MAELFVLGSQDAFYSENNDGANYILDNKFKIDMGTFSLLNMLNNDIEPESISTVLFTHMHADHTYCLPAFLFYYWTHGGLERITLIGPKEQLKARYDMAYNYAFSQHPELLKQRAFGDAKLIELSGNETLTIGDYSINTTSSIHAVPGLCYKIINTKTNKSIGFSGDTMYKPDFPDFFNNCDLLVYECSWGKGPINPKDNEDCKHSSAEEAVKAAELSKSKKLLLTHCRKMWQEEALSKAKNISSVPVDFAQPNQTYTF